MVALPATPQGLQTVRRNGRALWPQQSGRSDQAEPSRLGKLSTAGLWIGRVVSAEMVAPGGVVRADLVAPLRRNGRGVCADLVAPLYRTCIKPLATFSFLYPVVEALPSVDSLAAAHYPGSLDHQGKKK